MSLFSSFNNADDKLEIKINGARTNNGYILLSLFNASDGFPDKNNKAYRKLQLTLNNNATVAEFKGLPVGEYAVAILHDENNDQKMNTNWVGWPKEGFGFSNNAMGMFGPPSFNKAKVEYKGGVKVIEIQLKYF